ncbi:hypothetical protein BG53_09410 [Paenibacillus darwinianus]|uniref:YtpI-like protein n=1 Tax=Paenibacillus darwinianus TaxID=1380763 RepID=A0A9W5S2P9_9BACL|nr:YtpI family protein [Paenibacillus darwinianus]EXX91594.1 hypothetical protein CH50_13355 [Paenibacillus darwinianus]EXX91738.1 hypothetical protein BG53_09410 [Paenibacillus darwinianus]EXX92455.1 hypothetical protein BG52_12680 [Paenibacillus darwinianus]
MAILQWLLAGGILLTLLLTVFYSYKARRNADGRLRGLYAARTNICMGFMLVFMSLMQMVLFSGSSLRIVIGAVFLLLGLFNLFAGLKNHSLFRSRR